MEFLGQTKIDFLGKRKIAFLFSGTLILIGLIALVLRGGPIYSIDFTGGTSLQLKFEKSIATGELRSALNKVGLGNAEVKQLGQPIDNEMIIRVQESGGEKDIAQLIETELINDFKDNPFDIRRVDTVGPKIGSELRRAAILSVLISLIAILAYISWRFEFRFAVGAVIALVHDVLITLGLFSIFGLEISLTVIAAFLTIVGYSLNDTIVVFDRIRENLKILRRDTTEIIINTSINQTLSRTILTSFTTLIVIIVLYFFGGQGAIHIFAFALMVGIIIGTYSSIYVASAIVIEWEIRSEMRKGRSQMLRNK